MKSLLVAFACIVFSVPLWAQSKPKPWTERIWFNAMAQKYYSERDYAEAEYYLRKVIDTDPDSLLEAANAYAFIARIHDAQRDTSGSRAAEAMEVQLVNQSLAKYPDNMNAYIQRLSLYKFSEDKKGEAELIKTAETKFSNRWEMNFVLAYHYVYYDFVWPGSPEFDKCTAYLKKAVELNPNEFNSLLLLAVAYEKDKPKREAYLKKMYQVAPKQFTKNTGASGAKNPYKVMSVQTQVFYTRDLTVVLSKEECAMLGIKTP